MLNVLWMIGAFFVALMILVAVHEYGHFWVARRLGVKVLRFSIGFGKVIGSWHDKKGTQYAISVVPLGGYVKMLDEREGPVADEDLPYAFNRKSLWVRTAVVLAGPLFNLLFAIVAYWLMFTIGIAQLAPVIGDVEANSIAATAGLKPQTEIIAVRGEPTTSWTDVRLQILTQVGNTGVISITTKPLNNAQTTLHQLDLQNWQVDSENLTVLPSLGLTAYIPEIPAEVGAVLINTPASEVGLKKGDVILSVNGKAVQYWLQFLDEIVANPGKRIDIKIQRNDKTLTLSPRLDEKQVNGEISGYLGVQSTFDWPKGTLRINRYNPLAAIIPAVQSTWDMFILSWQMLGKMITGSLSLKSLSGPVGIAQGAGYSASLGISYFLNFLALISISLAMVNLLPIPLLDGGHLLYYLVEAIVRKPVSEKVQMLGMRVGIIFLLSVMLLAFYNDLARW